jgi:outer membrane biosynthesis protein TonB
MRITSRREYAQGEAGAGTRQGRRRRLSAAASAALLVALGTQVGVVPEFTGAAFGAQVPADDPPPDCAIPPLVCPDPPAPDPPAPAPDPPAPVPDPPKTTATPTPKASPEPSVSAPKNKKKHHKRKQHKTSVTAATPTPSVPASDPVETAAFSAPKESTAHHVLRMFIPPVKILSPAASATPVAATQERTRLVSDESRPGHGLFWFAFADMAAIVLLVGGALWRRRRVGPQW